jgi:hypothetical protein
MFIDGFMVNWCPAFVCGEQKSVDIIGMDEAV